MIEHPKAIAAAVGLLAAIPGVIGSMLPWLNDLRTLLVVVSLMVAMGTGLLGLWFRKLIRDREDEREASEERREDRWDQRIKALEGQNAQLKGVIDRAILEHSHLAKQVQQVAEDVRRAHERLDAGRETFAKLEVQVASIRARQRRAAGGDSDG